MVAAAVFALVFVLVLATAAVFALVPVVGLAVLAVVPVAVAVVVLYACREVSMQKLVRPTVLSDTLGSDGYFARRS